MRQIFGVALTQVEVARIRGDGEGLFVEAEEAEVHGWLRIPTQPPEPEPFWVGESRLARVSMPDPKRPRISSIVASNREAGAPGPENRSACCKVWRSLTPTPNRRT